MKRCGGRHIVRGCDVRTFLQMGNEGDVNWSQHLSNGFPTQVCSWPKPRLFHRHLGAVPTYCDTPKKHKQEGEVRILSLYGKEDWNNIHWRLRRKMSPPLTQESDTVVLVLLTCSVLQVNLKHLLITRSQYMVAFLLLPEQVSLWASLLCLFFFTGSSKQSLAVSLPQQWVVLSSSLSSVSDQCLQKSPALAPQCFSPWLLHETWGLSTSFIFYPAVSCRSSYRMGTCRAALWKSNSSQCSAGTMIVCFPQCHSYFGLKLHCLALWWSRGVWLQKELHDAIGVDKMLIEL